MRLLQTGRQPNGNGNQLSAARPLRERIGVGVVQQETRFNLARNSAVAQIPLQWRPLRTSTGFGVVQPKSFGPAVPLIALPPPRHLVTERLVPVFSEEGFLIVRPGAGTHHHLFTSNPWFQNAKDEKGRVQLKFNWRRVAERDTDFICLLRTDTRRVVLLENWRSRHNAIVTWDTKSKPPRLILKKQPVELEDAVFGSRKFTGDGIEFFCMRMSSDDPGRVEHTPLAHLPLT